MQAQPNLLLRPSFVLNISTLSEPVQSKSKYAFHALPIHFWTASDSTSMQIVLLTYLWRSVMVVVVDDDRGVHGLPFTTLKNENIRPISRGTGRGAQASRGGEWRGVDTAPQTFPQTP